MNSILNSISTTADYIQLGDNGVHASRNRHNGNIYIAWAFYMGFIIGIS